MQGDLLPESFQRYGTRTFIEALLLAYDVPSEDQGMSGQNDGTMTCVLRRNPCVTHFLISLVTCQTQNDTGMILITSDIIVGIASMGGMQVLRNIATTSINLYL